MSFEAKYRGYCDNCESTIYPGDEVEYGDEELTHIGCTPKPERKTETCTTCWLIKPCECEDTK